MSSSRTHPHTDMPPEGDLAGLILEKYPAHRELYLETHRLILDAVPDLRYSVDLHDATIGYGARQFGYDGWGMAALAPHKGWVSLVLFRGTVLDDPEGLLEGTGALVRHVKLRSLEDLVARREPLARLLKAAAGIA
ncbi:MAG: DUF1801 domain-containing protein [Coriobacteriia bacterium]|nr:DUF1801 domain-containing protein [Coriobacteriia bacterium]